MKKHTIFSALFILVMAFAGCRDEHETAVFYFGASVDQPISNQKVDMMEEAYIYFQKGDKISIASDKSYTDHLEEDEDLVGVLTSISSGGEGDYYHQGTFTTSLSIESKKFCAVYPQHDDIRIKCTDESTGEFEAECWFPRVQEYVSDETFGKLSYPMVAWSTRDSAYFEFHSLCGIVRFQFYAPATGGFTIDSVQCTSTTKKLSGFFDVKDMETNVPYVGNTEKEGRQSNTVSISCPTPISAANLCTFYLTLPAFYNTFKLYDDLNLILYGKTSDGKKAAYTLSQKFKAYVGPRNIYRMTAINVNDWIKYNDGDNTVNPTGISGNGTQVRPFEIYTVKDLVKVRDAFNTTGGKLNGINVQGGSYYFKIMRNDIELTKTNWTSGIKNFSGTMVYESGTSTNPGITNISQSPVFESIATTGTVKDLTIKGNSTSITGLASSPLCKTNDGTLESCHINSTFICASLKLIDGIGGICHTNTGTIKGCGNSGKFDAGTYNVASICYLNKGTIKDCNITGVTLSGKQIGGICHTNTKSVESCSFTATMGSGLSCDFGGIVFKQTESDARIYNCQVQSSTTISTSGTCGGIVNTLENGTVDYCGNHSQYTCSGKLNGGIVATMANGTIINCYFDNDGFTSYTASGTENFCGGIAGEMKDGTIHNSFCAAGVASSGGYSGSVVGNFSGGTITNCYGWPSNGAHNFYGKTSGSGNIENCWNYNNTPGEGSGITKFDGLPGGVPVGDVLNALNTNRGGGNKWNLATATTGHPNGHPILTSSASKARKLNRKK